MNKEDKELTVFIIFMMVIFWVIYPICMFFHLGYYIEDNRNEFCNSGFKCELTTKRYIINNDSLVIENYEFKKFKFKISKNVIINDDTHFIIKDNIVTECYKFDFSEAIIYFLLAYLVNPFTWIAIIAGIISKLKER